MVNTSRPIPNRIRPPDPVLPHGKKGFVYKVTSGFQRIYVSQSSDLAREIRCYRQEGKAGLYRMGETHHFLWIEDQETRMQWLRPLSSPDKLTLFADIEWEEDRHSRKHRALAESVWAERFPKEVQDKETKDWIYAFRIGEPGGTGGVMLMRKSVQLDWSQVELMQRMCPMISILDKAAMPWEEAE